MTTLALLRTPKNPIADLKTGLPTPEWLFWLQKIADDLASIETAPGTPTNGNGAVHGSGTVGQLAKWIEDDTLGDSIVSEAGDLVTVDGTVSAQTLQGNLSTSYLVGFIPWTQISGTPTTLAGYGITDAAPLVHTHPWSDITGTPTTLAGYGIVDGQPLDTTLTTLSALADAAGVLTNDGTGVLTWGAGGGGGTPSVEYRGEVVTGAINGVNTVYTTAHNYVTGLLAVYLNGQRLTLTTDFTETTATTFTMVLAPLTGDLVTVDYMSVPGVSGVGAPTTGLILLQTVTAAASATLDFAAAITSTYDEYVIEVVNLVHGAADTVQILVSTNAGVSYDTTAIYDYVAGYTYNGGQGYFGATAGANWPIRNTATTLATNGSFTATFRLFDPLGARFTTIQGMVAIYDAAAGLIMIDYNSVYKSTTAVNAIRFKSAAGTFSTGIVRMYGVAK